MSTPRPSLQEESVTSPAETPEMPPGTYVQSLERGLSIIRAFDAEHPELTLAEAAES